MLDQIRLYHLRQRLGMTEEYFTDEQVVKFALDTLAGNAVNLQCELWNLRDKIIQSLPKPIKKLMLPETSSYRPGETVKVYVDPVSRTHFEAEAELVEHFGNVGHLERWSVRFPKTRNRTFPRYIKAREQ